MLYLGTVIDCSHARTCTGHSADRGFIQTRSPSPSQSISEDTVPPGFSIFGTSVGPASHSLQYWLKHQVPPHTWHHVSRWARPTLQLWPLGRTISGWNGACRSDSMTVVSYINRQGGLSSRRLFILAKCLLRWAQHNLRLLRAMHVQGKLNLGADMLSRSNVPSDEWTLHPQTVQETWGIFGRPEVDLFASEENKGQGCVGPRLAQPPPLCFPPDRPDHASNQANQGTEAVLLVAPLWRSQHWFAELARLLTAAPWLIPLRRYLLSRAYGTIWHP